MDDKKNLSFFIYQLWSEKTLKVNKTGIFVSGFINNTLERNLTKVAFHSEEKPNEIAKTLPKLH